MKPGILFVLIVLSLAVPSCSKTGSPATTSTSGGGVPPPPPPPPPAPPTIASIVPDSGAYNTTVIITGTNFNTTATGDTVRFNNTVATVSNATATQLTVTVPQGAGSGAVKVTVTGSTVTGPVFNYLYTYTVTTLAGSTKGDVDATGTAAEFNYPYGIAVDTSGNIIVADDFNNKIRKVTPAGVVTTIAGTGSPGFKDGPAATALFTSPPAVAVDANNNIFVGDDFNYKVREITPDGNVSTVAGTTVGETNGPIATAQFDGPTWLAIDAKSNIYVCDGHYIRTISGGSVATLYDGKSYSSTLNSFTSIVLAPNGNLILLDDYGANVFSLTTGGVFSVLAGNGILAYLDGPATSASFSSASGVCIDTSGNILVADAANQRIRLITPAGAVSTIAGSGTAGDNDAAGTSAQFYYPHGVAVDKKTGNIYVLEPMTNRVRKITKL